MDGRTLTPERLALACAGVAALVFLGALGNGFAYDDLVLITGDPGIRSLDGLWTRLGQPSWPGAFGLEVGAWRPMTTATWAFVWAVAGESTVAFHALGVILHAVCTALVVLVVAELSTREVAGLAGALFAVHPVHTEAIANVVGSAEPISAVFALGAVLVHLRGGARYGPGRVAAVTVLYALATLSKESAAVLPLILFILDGTRRDTSTDRGPFFAYVRARLLLYVSLAAILAVILLQRADIVGAVTGATHPHGGAMLRDEPRVWTVFSTWVQYLRLLFFPASLSPDYSPGVVPVVFHWSPSAMLGAALGLTAFVGTLLTFQVGHELDHDRSSPRLAGLGVLWIAAALLPVSNVLYLGPVLVAERTLYLPSVGACLILAWLLASLAQLRGRAIWGAAALLVLAGAARTVTRVPDWKDTETVMSALIEEHPISGTGWETLGRRFAMEGRHEQALRAYAWAIAFHNSEYRPSTHVATQLMTMGRPEQARFFLRRAWMEEPQWYTAPGLLAAVELNTGRPVEAAAAARAATILEPTNPSMHQLLAQALAGQERWAEAATAREAAIRNGFADRAATWLQLADDRLRAGAPGAAAAALDSAAVRTLSDADATRLDELRAELSSTSGGGTEGTGGP